MRIAPREMFKAPNDPRLLAVMKSGFVKAMISRTMSRHRKTGDAAEEERTGAPRPE
jgi:hypothetical protein